MGTEHGTKHEQRGRQMMAFLAPAVACLYFTVAHRLRTASDPKPVAVSAETVGLWAGSFACAVAGFQARNATVILSFQVKLNNFAGADVKSAQLFQIPGYIFNVHTRKLFR